MDRRHTRFIRAMRFLSVRFIVFNVCVLIAVISMLVCLFRYDRLDGVIYLIITLAATAVYYFFVVVPFVKSEARMRRMIRGFMTVEEPGSHTVSLTPASEEMISAVYDILNSDKTVNLNKRQAQYLALQNQINPHFLYNTLDGIRSEALIAGLDNLADMTEALASFFRYTISNVENLVTIDEELDNCRTYFRIQQYRFGDRLSCRIEKEEDLGKYLIPKLTLQPILENSIIHGTEMKIGEGLTIISVRRTDLRIVIDIKDNGVGMDEDTLGRLNSRLDNRAEDIRNPDKASGGIALTNVNNRIHLLFGQEYGIHIYSMKDIGTTVEISLPAVTEKQMAQRETGDEA